MKALLSALALSALYLSALAAAPRVASAQLIGLKTVPLAAGDQFLIFPARNLGMGGASIAYDDPLSDPFVNPAKGGRLAQSQFFSSPTFYSISDETGGAQTVPVGALLSADRWFGGAVAALQQVDMGSRLRRRAPRLDPAASALLPPLPRNDALVDRSSTNKYFQMVLGRRLGDGAFSLAASVMVADLNAMDGVEQLFANAWEIDEFGHMQDYRLGVTGELSGGGTFEAVLVHNRFTMTHDVTSVTFAVTDSLSWLSTPDVQQEANLDKTRTWGAHLGYVRPIGETDWRIGGILTANRKVHPKIPTYDLVSVQLPVRTPIPRDPGDSWAYNIGVGVSHQEGPTTFAMDLVYEPAVSNTWADAESDVTAADGSIIPAGGKTVENRFVFSNARVNVGLSHDVGQGAIQYGVRVRHYDYRLRQDDRVEMTRRSQTEQWTEWTPTWGFRLTLPNVELRYSGSASSASHFPFLGSGGTELRAFANVDIDILAPPTGALTTPEETVVTHRIAVSLPIR